MSKQEWDFEGRCSECGKKVNILINRISPDSMVLKADACECLGHEGKSHILWPQRDDIIDSS